LLDRFLLFDLSSLTYVPEAIRHKLSMAQGNVPILGYPEQNLEK
jgi:hypothetical protein